MIYVSLAALPIFGVGQLLIPRTDSGRRDYAFVLLCVYVGSALGLLLTSSFLGLRRYLRQRYLQMPASIAGAWIGFGAALALAVLLFSVLLPRPEASYSLTSMIDRIGSPPQSASERALLRGEAAEGEGQRTGERKGQAQPPGELGGSGQSESAGDKQGVQPSTGSQGRAA